MPPSSPYSPPTTTTRDAYGRTLLHTTLSSSSSNNDDTTILHILQKQPHLSSLCDEWNQSPLHHAIYFARSTTIVNELIHRCDVEKRQEDDDVMGDSHPCRSVVEWRDKDGDTPIHIFYKLWCKSVMQLCRQRRRWSHNRGHHGSESLMMTINERDDETSLSPLTKMMITSEYGDERSILEVYETFISLCRARWKNNQRHYYTKQPRRRSSPPRRQEEEDGHDEEQNNGDRDEMDSSSFCPLIASIDDRECPYSFVRLVLELQPWLARSRPSSSSRHTIRHYLPLHACLVMMTNDNNNDTSSSSCHRCHDNIPCERRRQLRVNNKYLRRGAKRRTCWYCNDDRKLLDYNCHQWTTKTTTHTDNDVIISSSSLRSSIKQQQQERCGSVIDKISRVISDLISIYPFAASLPDTKCYGCRLPLHTAIMTQRTVDDYYNNNDIFWWDHDYDNIDDNDSSRNSGNYKSLISVIYKASPRALSTRDVSTHLYPFMLAAATTVGCGDGRVVDEQERHHHHQQRRQMTISFRLLVENPQLVCRGIN